MNWTRIAFSFPVAVFMMFGTVLGVLVRNGTVSVNDALAKFADTFGATTHWITEKFISVFPIEGIQVTQAESDHIWAFAVFLVPAILKFVQIQSADDRSWIVDGSMLVLLLCGFVYVIATSDGMAKFTSISMLQAVGAFYLMPLLPVILDLGKGGLRRLRKHYTLDYISAPLGVMLILFMFAGSGWMTIA